MWLSGSRDRRTIREDVRLYTLRTQVDQVSDLLSAQFGLICVLKVNVVSKKLGLAVALEVATVLVHIRLLWILDYRLHAAPA